MNQPAFKSAPSGRTRVRKYTVWSLDVWGHGSDTCTDHDCPCVVTCDEHGADEPAKQHDENSCECHFDVNDRCRVGEVEVTEHGELHNVGTPHQFESFSATNEQIIQALIEGDYLRAPPKDADVEPYEIDDPSCDGESFYIQLAGSGEPLLQLESENE